MCLELNRCLRLSGDELRIGALQLLPQIVAFRGLENRIGPKMPVAAGGMYVRFKELPQTILMLSRLPISNFFEGRR